MFAHIAQAVIYRKGYSWVIIVSCLMQFACYIFRVLSIKNPNSSTDAIAWFILILVSNIPLLEVMLDWFKNDSA